MIFDFATKLTSILYVFFYRWCHDETASAEEPINLEQTDQGRLHLLLHAFTACWNCDSDCCDIGADKILVIQTVLSLALELDFVIIIPVVETSSSSFLIFFCGLFMV